MQNKLQTLTNISVISEAILTSCPGTAASLLPKYVHELDDIHHTKYLNFIFLLNVLIVIYIPIFNNKLHLMVLECL
jgi:hypothetical protein